MNGGRGLRQFQNVHKLEEWGLKVGCQTGKFPEPMPQIPADFELDSVAVCTDQLQEQITGGEFIVKPEAIGGLDCTGVRFIDDFHRWTNDLSSATAKAGLKPVEKAATLFLNIGYGPLQSEDSQVPKAPQICDFCVMDWIFGYMGWGPKWFPQVCTIISHPFCQGLATPMVT